MDTRKVTLDIGGEMNWLYEQCSILDDRRCLFVEHTRSFSEKPVWPTTNNSTRRCHGSTFCPRHSNYRRMLLGCSNEAAENPHQIGMVELRRMAPYLINATRLHLHGKHFFSESSRKEGVCSNIGSNVQSNATCRPVRNHMCESCQRGAQ